ncbi:MAG: hypothetical protein Aurels2KO_30740 [Aureliella sp.]
MMCDMAVDISVYLEKASRIGRSVYEAQHGVDVDEQAGPAYFAGLAASRWVFWRRLKAAMSAIPDGPSGTAVDFGCGFGLALPILRERFTRTIAVDLMPNLAADFLSHWDVESPTVAPHRVEFVSALENAEIANGSVDLVLALDVFEHIEPLAPLLQRLDQLMSPSGAIVVSGPTESAWYCLGRRLVGSSGDYHVSDIYGVEKNLSTQFDVCRAGRIPFFPTLFQLLIARKAAE